jgi:hypothetical protein
LESGHSPAGADIRDTCPSQEGSAPNADAAILLIVADRLDSQIFGVEDQPIFGGLLLADCAVRGGDRFNGWVAEARQVEILGGPEWIIQPSGERHRAFEDEAITKGRQTHAM